jgi:5-methylcytosine-specific restriction endonuclease McrA
VGEPYYDPKKASESQIPDYHHPNFLPVRWIRDFKPIKYEKVVFLRPTIAPFENRAILNTIESYFNLDTSNSEADLQNSAINDIPSAPIGSKTPDRIETSGLRYQRDDKVRKFVIQQAEGTCEYCGKLGFLLPDDSRYLEAHHIIALAKQGPDTVENVIALCPSDHREAHYGKRRVEIETEMLEIIQKRQTSRF